MEVCLRHMATRGRANVAFGDEVCLEVLSAADFLCLSGLRAIAARRAAGALIEMDEATVRSIPRSMVSVIIEGATAEAWKAVSGNRQLSWLLEGGDSDEMWHRASDRRWRGQADARDGGQSSWRGAFVQRLVQANVDQIATMKKQGEPVSRTLATTALSAARGIASPEEPVRSLRVNREAVLESIAEMATIAATLWSLDLTGIERGAGEMISAVISRFPSLSSLCLRGTKLRAVGSRILADSIISSGASERLVSLNVADCGIGVDASGELWRLVERGPHLTFLDVSNNPLFPASARGLAAAVSSGSSRLHVLGLSDCKLTATGIREIARVVGSSRTIHSVFVGANLTENEREEGEGEGGEEGAIESWAGAIRKRREEIGQPLIVLELSGRQPLTSTRTAEVMLRRGRPIGPTTAAPIVALASAMGRLEIGGWHSLHKLFLDGIPLCSESAAALASAAARGGLACLSVSGCLLPNVGIRVLAAAKGLMSLNISGNNVDIATADSVAESLGAWDCSLTTLDMTAMGLTDRCAVAIFGALARNKSLTSLAVAGNPIGGRSEAAIVGAIRADTTLTQLNLSFGNLALKKAMTIGRAGGGWRNEVLTKLDVSHNKGLKPDVLAFAQEFLPNLVHIDVSLSTSASSPSWGRCLGQFLSENRGIEELVLRSTSTTTLEPLLRVLEKRRETRLRLLHVFATHEVAADLIRMAPNLESVSELSITCGRDSIEGLSSRVDCLGPTRLTLHSIDEAPLEFPSWAPFPAAPFPFLNQETAEIEGQLPSKRQKVQEE